MYLVVGGRNDVSHFSSTEILVTGATSWQTTSSIPFSVAGLRAVNHNNNILIFGAQFNIFSSLTINMWSFTGGSDDNGSSSYDDIYQFDTLTETWNSFGSMKYGRFYHAVDLVNYKDFSQFCSNVRTGTFEKWQKK